MVSSPGFQSGNVGFESRFARSGLSIARPEPTRNNPLGCFLDVDSPLGSLWLSYNGQYLRLWI